MNKKTIILIIFTAVMFGLGGGFLGALATKSYFFEQTHNIPLFGQLSLSPGNLGGASIIIQDPRKIVVEHDVKINETVMSSKNSLVGIFKKIEPSENNSAEIIRLNDYYHPSTNLGEGIAVTSDGWIITNYLTPELIELFADKEANREQIKEALSGLVIITKKNEVYSVVEAVYDYITGFVFLRIEAKNLPIKKTAKTEKIFIGQTVIALSWNERAGLADIAEKIEKDPNPLKASDFFVKKLILTKSAEQQFEGSFIFNLSGELIALTNNRNEPVIAENLNYALNNLLKTGEIKYPYLGINYADLSELIHNTEKNNKKGALIYKNEQAIAVEENSPAQIAGLKESDIIYAINNTEINQTNNLNELINSYQPGDTIKIDLIKNNKKEEIKVVLGELKQN